MRDYPQQLELKKDAHEYRIVGLSVTRSNLLASDVKSCAGSGAAGLDENSRPALEKAGVRGLDVEIRMMINDSSGGEKEHKGGSGDVGKRDNSIPRVDVGSNSRAPGRSQK